MPSSLEPIVRALEESRNVLDTFIADPGTAETLDRMAISLSDCFAKGGKALSCGNGGSACDALHFAEEFTGRFKKDRKALPVIPLLDGANLTCVANDYGFESTSCRTTPTRRVTSSPVRCRWPSRPPTTSPPVGSGSAARPRPA
jgi:phosphoheptose isomerase